jgi:hypothetical protein
MTVAKRKPIETHPQTAYSTKIDDYRIEIFHAMKARKTFLARLGLKEKP